MNLDAANQGQGLPAAHAAAGTASPSVSLLVVAGTPPASWLDATAPWRGAALPNSRQAGALERWLDDVVGVGARALARQSAWAGGKALTLTEAQQQSLSRLAADGAALAIDARACWALEALAAAHPEARYLLFVDHPARALTEWLELREGDDLRLALRVWQGGARRLLSHAHRHRSACLLIDAEEARSDPAALVDACRRFVGGQGDAATSVAAAAAVPVPATGADPLAWALAEALLATESAARALYEELRAATTALADSGAQIESLRWASRLDAPAAARRWQQLSAAAHDAERLTRLAAERAQQLESALAQHDHARAALAVAEQHAQQAQAQSQRLALQLQQVKEELGHQFGAREAAERLAAERSQRLESTEAERRRLLDLAKQRLAQTEQLGRRLEEQSRLATRHSQRFGQTLAELRSFEGSRSHAIATLIGYAVANTRFGAERAQPPHRQLDVALQDLRCGRRRFERLDVRLAHHLGHPGLLFFAAADEPPPLGAWQETGREGPRPFMLLFPSDSAAQNRLATLGTTDWGLVLGVAATLVQELQRADAGLRTRWLAVAQQLQAQLHDLPARLRYDAVRTTPTTEGGAPSLSVSFERVAAGARVLPALRLRWWPTTTAAAGDRHAAVEIVAPDDASGPPLLDAWPVDDGGAWAARLALPVGGALDPPARREAWERFSEHDRRFFVALLDTLPAAARAVADADLPPGMTRPVLESAARRLRLQARRLVAGSTLRRWVRLVRERLTRR